MTSYAVDAPEPADVRFSTGRRLRRADRIVPVFLPFAGCPRRCVFCAQDRQTGAGAEDAVSALRRVAAALDAMQVSRAADGGTPFPRLELAFYGGTFTALPPDVLEEALALYARGRHRGLLDRARCSTRPDALEQGVLDRLAGNGLDLVELGVQSFDDAALAQARRGYDGRTAQTGCQAVRRAGLSLGIQLLPGMPGVTPDIFLADVDRALSLDPACLRFYPCVVPEGTGLAELWRAGRYAPWTVEQTVRTLGEGLRRAWQAGVPVIRLAVAPEKNFDAALLAGPRHPALGSLIQAEALRSCGERALRALGRPPRQLSLPRSCQGYMYGQRGALQPAWNALGLPPERIRFHAEPEELGLLW